MAKENSGQADHADKPRGGLDINDLEMAGNIFSWLVLEGIVSTENIHYKYIGIFRYNTAAVSWTQRGAGKNSAAAERLIIVLDLR